MEIQVAGQAGFGERTPGRAALDDEVPEGIEAVGPGEPAGHADDRKRFVHGGESSWCMKKGRRRYGSIRPPIATVS